MNTPAGLTDHPAYVSHRLVAQYEGFTLVEVTYRVDHPDYEGGVELECWDDNDEHVDGVRDEADFRALVNDVLAERAECEEEDGQ